MALGEKTYFASLRRIRRELKYETLNDLIGREVFIEHRDKISESIHRALRDSVPNSCAETLSLSIVLMRGFTEFPIRYRVTEACITNSPRIWLFKNLLVM